jgi:hypothetical protein
MNLAKKARKQMDKNKQNHEIEKASKVTVLNDLEIFKLNSKTVQVYVSKCPDKILVVLQDYQDNYYIVEGNQDGSVKITEYLYENESPINQEQFESELKKHIEAHEKYLGSPKNGTSHSGLLFQLTEPTTPPNQFYKELEKRKSNRVFRPSSCNPTTTPSNKTIHIDDNKLKAMLKTPDLVMFFTDIMKNLDFSTNIVKSIPNLYCRCKTKKLINKLIDLKILRYSRAKRAYVVMDGVYSFVEGVE